MIVLRKHNLALLGFTVALLLFQTACYTFTGASIPPAAKTVSVDFFPNKAPLVQPTLSQLFTERLKDRLSNQTRLSLVSSDGDLSFSGEITGYSTAPEGIVAGEQVNNQRLTITVHVKFINDKDSKLSYDASFSRYASYPSIKNLSEVENELIYQIVEQLTEDAFNKAVAAL